MIKKVQNFGEKVHTFDKKVPNLAVWSTVYVINLAIDLLSSYASLHVCYKPYWSFFQPAITCQYNEGVNTQGVKGVVSVNAGDNLNYDETVTVSCMEGFQSAQPTYDLTCQTGNSDVDASSVSCTGM